ncbi:transcriptional regulator [Leminorella grimontii]|uniref:Transcriptional regulator n=1 Tax=Leminorella grimontii TaxID=82981 RepID=A0AAV5MYJ6_9GAMM|nr:helix-turn-helix domain-containing protein [Leminorella grimontii]KFC95910.1 AraC family transcriptional regulator [Leminorella grimontii ATCC 33999 = DSM 5078]GKX54911.1 transcriptional regulator [Leminorella grimontii]GKX58330.1 transcriptional regulator [Leminorella grimontii]
MPIRKSIVKDTLLWVEKHIEDDIDISQVTEISGYCRRQIQTVFKLYTRENLGCYIRQRKLSRASMLLKLTNLRIGDIAHKMGFESSQSFNRAFKKHFGCTPLQFRNALDWDFSRFRAAINLDGHDYGAVIPELCYLKKVFHTVLEVMYQEPELSIVSDNSKVLKLSLIRDNMRLLATNICMLYDLKLDSRVSGALTIACTVATERTRSVSTVVNVEGRYAKFHFDGSVENFFHFSRYIYTNVLPKYRIKRREGKDIEIFTYNGAIFRDRVNIKCDYYVPVV